MTREFEGHFGNSRRASKPQAAAWILSAVIQKFRHFFLLFLF